MHPSGGIPLPGPFLASDEILATMESSGIYIIAIFFILLVTGYGFIFLKRGIRYLKMKESRYIDGAVLDSLETTLKVLWGLMVIFLCLALLGMAWEWFRVNVWLPISHNPDTGVGYMGPFLICTVVALFVLLTIRFLHHNIQYQAGFLKLKPKSPWNPRVAMVIELFTKYFVIAVGVVMIITIGLTAIGYYEYLVGGLWSWVERNRSGLIFVVFVIFLGFFFIKVSEAFVEDMRKKEIAMSPQILTLAKISARYLILLIVGIVVLFSILKMFELEETGIIIVIVFIVLLAIIGAIAAASNLRNAFSGIIIMVFRPFVEGDTVKILDGVICDIVSIGIIFTRVKTLRGEVIEVPNNEVLHKPIFNYCKSDDYAISIMIGVPHESDINMIKELVKQSAMDTPLVRKKKPPKVFHIGMENDRIFLEVQIYTKSLKKMRQVKSKLIHNMSKSLKDKGICCSVHVSDRDESEMMGILKGHHSRPEHERQQ